MWMFIEVELTDRRQNTVIIMVYTVMKGKIVLLRIGGGTIEGMDGCPVFPQSVYSGHEQ